MCCAWGDYMGKRFGLLVWVVFCMSTPLYASNLQGDVEIGLDKLDGDTTYEIGGKISEVGVGSGIVHFPISKLEFPLGVYLISAKAGVTFGDAWRIGIGLKKNITRKAGELTDSDWGYWWLKGYSWARQDTLDIYSESDASLDALLWDLHGSYTIKLKGVAARLGLDTCALRFGVGYIHQTFDYDITNLDQWYPSYDYYQTDIENDPDIPPATKNTVKGHIYNTGKVLTYTVDYTLFPMLETGVLVVFPQGFSLETDFSFCPLARAEDDDHHILRNKVSTGDCDGTAVLASVKAGYTLAKALTIGLHYDYLSIYTEGTQTQTDPDFTGTIDQHIESRQHFLGVSLGYSF